MLYNTYIVIYNSLPWAPSSQYGPNEGPREAYPPPSPKTQCQDSEPVCTCTRVCLILPSRLAPSARPNMSTKGWNPAAPGRIRVPATGPCPTHELSQATSKCSQHDIHSLHMPVRTEWGACVLRKEAVPPNPKSPHSTDRWTRPCRKSKLTLATRSQAWAMHPVV